MSPRNVRNFWIETRVDGRASLDETGPQAKDGGFQTIIRLRDHGSIGHDVVRITGRVMSDGKLILEVELPKDRTVGQIDSHTYRIVSER